MKSKEIIFLPQTLQFSEDIDNTALSLLVAFNKDILLKQIGKRWANLQMLAPDQIKNHIIFDMKDGVTYEFNPYNRVCIILISMFEFSTLNKVWIKVPYQIMHQELEYSDELMKSVIYNLYANNYIEIGKDIFLNLYYKFKYNNLIDCKLDKDGFFQEIHIRDNIMPIASAKDALLHMESVIIHNVKTYILGSDYVEDDDLPF